MGPQNLIFERKKMILEQHNVIKEGKIVCNLAIFHENGKIHSFSLDGIYFGPNGELNAPALCTLDAIDNADDLIL